MMKIFTSMMLTGCTAFAFSQNYSVAPSNTMDEQIDLNVYTTTTINIAHDNLTTDSVEIQWEIIENNMLSGWDYSWCAYLDCFGSNITSGTFDKFGPSQTAFFKVNLNPMSVAGSGSVKVMIFDTNTPGVIDTLTYNYNAILGLEGIDLNADITVYPNPILGDELTINGLVPNTEINIVNANGQTVLSEGVNSIESKINIESLDNGVYFLKLSHDGIIYSTRKLIVK